MNTCCIRSPSHSLIRSFPTRTAFRQRQTLFIFRQNGNLVIPSTDPGDFVETVPAAHRVADSGSPRAMSTEAFMSKGAAASEIDTWRFTENRKAPLKKTAFQPLSTRINLCSTS
jgi:hypothetical protein